MNSLFEKIQQIEPRKGLEVFQETGVIVIPRDETSRLNFDSLRSSLLNLLEEYQELAKEKGGLGLKKENGFRELVQKDSGRYDLNLDHLLPEGTIAHSATPASSSNREFSANENAVLEIFKYVHSRIDPQLKEIFGHGYLVNAFGAVISSPNTAAQGWHVDSSHLFVANNESKQHLLSQLPCHFVTVFCPLYDYDPLIGPTEIATGSYKYTSILGNQTVEDQYPASPVVERLLSSPNVSQMSMMTKMGDIGIMDGRTLHRGGFNQSDRIRPLVYLSFCLPWYYEYPRSQNDARSLF